MTDRTVYDAFLSLLQNALWGRDCTGVSLTPGQWEELFSLCRRQTVQALVFDVVSGLPSSSGLSASLAARWLLDTRSVENDYKRMRSVVELQRSAWEKHGVDAVLLKGISVAAYYPHPEHRICGDIDWWMEGENWDKALKVLSDNNITPQMDSDGDINYSLGGVTVEHHHNGYPADGPEGVLFILNEHIFHHLSVTGIGFRHLCDYAVALKHFQGQYDGELLRRLLNGAGLLEWSSLLHAVLVSELGLEPGYLPFGGPESSDADVDRFVSLVLSDGNFGLDKPRRFSGWGKRTALLLKYAPSAYIKRWFSLAKGRMKCYICKLK